MEVLFFGPYITRLIRGIGLIKAIRGMKKVIVLTSLVLVILQVMGMVKKIGTSKYALMADLIEELEEDPPLLEAVLMETKVLAAEQEGPPEPK